MKPRKSRSLSSVKGKVVNKKFAINEEVKPTVLEKPVKSLGRWYDASLSDKSQFEELRQETRKVLYCKNRQVRAAG